MVPMSYNEKHIGLGGKEGSQSVVLLGSSLFFSAFQFSLLETSFLGLKLWASYINITRAVIDKY